MIRYLIILLLVLGFGGFALWHMLKFLFSVQNSRSKVDKEINQARQEFKGLRSSLAPWDEKELELLSVVPGALDVSSGVNRSVAGSVKNIYEEDVILFRFKEYLSEKYRGFLIASTTDHEYLYKLEGREVDVYLDEKQIGSITESGSFENNRGIEVLTLQEIHSDAAQITVSNQGKNVALISNVKSSQLTNQRAVKLVNESESNNYKSEELLALTAFELIRNFSD